MLHNGFCVPFYTTQVKNQNYLENEFNSIISSLTFDNAWQPSNDTALTTFIPDKEEHIIIKFGMKNIETTIVSNVKNYLDQTEQIFDCDSITLTHSWINKFDTNQLIGFHDHGYNDNTVSGVYYYKVFEEGGNIAFKSPNPFTVSFPHQAQPYKGYFEIEPKAGMLILFPSWVEHSVTPNYRNIPRYSLAFNVCFDYKNLRTI